MDKRVPFLDLNAHHAAIRGEFDRAINEVIDSGAFAGGPFVEKFEADFAAYITLDMRSGSAAVPRRSGSLFWPAASALATKS